MALGSPLLDQFILQIDYPNQRLRFLNFVDRMGWLKKFKSTPNSSKGVLKQINTEIFYLPELKFGPYLLENIKVSTPAKGEQSNLADRRDKSVGILGYDILKHFMLTVDQKLGDVYIGIPKLVKN